MSVRWGSLTLGRKLPIVMALVAVASMLTAVTASTSAQAADYQPGTVQKEPVVSGRHLQRTAARQQSTGTPWKPPAPVWPEQSTVDVMLPSAQLRASGAGEPARAGDLPVWIDPMGAGADTLSKVRVQKVDGPGIALRVSRTDGLTAAAPARITVDYKGFRWANGGDWASRLRLWSVPSCALTTPEAKACQATPLQSVNDHGKGTLSGEAKVNGANEDTLLVVAAAPAGSAGDFSASSLSPSASWNGGGNTGDFSWSYPLRMPPAVSGPLPQVVLGYSSSSVDGRMAAANNQPSMIGEGFDWHPGFIERRYKPCADDMGSGANNGTKTGDLCWATENAILSLPGHTGELIKDGSNANRWHLRRDDSTFVERRTGGPNGGHNGEWWVATTTDGTQYWFGGRAGSQATLTVPVFGNHGGEPCHAAAFANSSCLQGYRWQLDHVVDTHGNTMRVSYAKETNRYSRNQNQSDAVVYDRAGYPEKIEYGTRLDSAATAPMQVVLTYGDRCLANCGIKDAAHWPDVPFDQECAAGPCGFNQVSPSFWTTKRLSNVKTQVWDAAKPDYRNVESWTLTHGFPDVVDSVTPGLWLEKISHSGLAGATTNVPDVTFVGELHANRVDTNSDQYPAMNRYRIKTINSETGGKTDVTYSAKDCVKGTRMPDKDNLQDNNLRCYPVKWTPTGHTAPINDFFHKYLVTDVAEAEQSGLSPRTITHYEHVGDPKWHYTDDDGLTKAEYKTWSVWRGYGTVITTKGDAGERTRVERRFFRGMHGDKNGSGTRTVELPPIAVGNVPAILDEDGFAGQVREEITYNDPHGEVSATVTQPWLSPATATRIINETTVHARFAGTAAVYTRTTLDGGRSHRTTSQHNTYDGYGMMIEQLDNGDDAIANDEKCVLTDYTRSTGSWIVDRVSQRRMFGVNCHKAKAGGLTNDDVISQVRTSYDQLAWQAAPVKGNVSLTEMMSAYNAGDPSFVTESKATYDSYGRPQESWDVRGAKTSFAYTPATGGPVTGTTVTNTFGWKTSVVLDPAWNVPTSTVDPNGRVTEMAYDGLGRLTGAWLPGRDRVANPHAPSVTYQYLIRNNAPTVVTSKILNQDGGYITSYTFFDNLMRPRQTQQADGAGGAGAVTTDMFYDSAGRAQKTHHPYLAAAAPGTNLFLPTGDVPAVTVTEYDGAGRSKALIHRVDESPASPGYRERWRTSYAYGGDRVDTTPPSGGVTTSAVTNVDGNMVELRQYLTGYTAGADTGFDKSTYSYNRKDQLASVTNAAGNVWRYTYDARGRLTETTDPDTGTVSTTYNTAGDVATRRDSRGLTLGYTYDDTGRMTTVRDDSTTGPKRAEWFYDKLANGLEVKGQLAKSVRYVGTAEYVKQIGGYTTGYQPTNVVYTIPGTATDPAGTFNYVLTYHQDGSPQTVRLPAIGDQAMETLTHGYNSLGKPTTVSTTLGGTYVTGTDYTSFSELGSVHLQNNTGQRADVLRAYETDTRRLTQIWTTRQEAPTGVADVRLSYDASGNVTKASDLTAGDHQCFNTDYLRRLTKAWTPSNGDCAAAPTLPALGGPAKYWHDYEYDKAGNRTQLVEHGTPAGDRTTDYTIPQGAHKLSTASTVGSAALSYSYDAAGNLRTRPTATAGTQTMTWDAEGHLATSTDSTGVTSFIYDAEGNRLIRKDPGASTLYLPGQELRASGSTKKASRYYTHAGQTIATRSASGLTWLASDQHGTAQFAISAAVGQSVMTRRDTPFGQIRGTSGNWPSAMDKGFVGGTNDNTGLTHLGAREYDPALGRFTSVDPLLDNKDPQQMNGYAYGNNNPATYSDPDGLIARSCPDGECKTGGGYKEGESPASKFNGRWQRPSYWYTTSARCPDGECHHGPYKLGQSPATKFRQGIPPREPYIISRCPDGKCSAATRPDLGKHNAWRAYEAREAAVGAELESTRQARIDREKAAECGVWCTITKVTDSGAFKWAGVLLSVVGLFICPLCAAVGFAMSFIGTAVTCANGNAGDCALGVASLALGGLGKGIGEAGQVALGTGRKLMAQVPRGYAKHNQGAQMAVKGQQKANAGLGVEGSGVLIDADGAAKGRSSESFKEFVTVG